MVDLTLRLLHISDLHERGPHEPEPWRRRRVLGASWERNLDAIREKGNVHLVCFTGDLAHSGKPEEYDRVSEFVSALLERLDLGPERLFAIPGNHDICRTTQPTAWRQVRKDLSQVSPLEVSRWVGGGVAPRGFTEGQLEALLSRQAAYRVWLANAAPGLLPQHDRHPNLGYRKSVRLPHLPFDVQMIGLDSAWLCGDEHDAGRLWLTEDQVLRLTSGPQGEDLSGLKLGLVHHPLGDLHDGSDARRLLAERIDLLLRGHLHETEPHAWSDPGTRRLYEAATGCLYEGQGADRYPNACQVITITCDTVGRPYRFELWFRRWSERGHWYDDNGLYEKTVDGRLIWLPAPIGPGDERFPRPDNRHSVAFQNTGFSGQKEVIANRVHHPPTRYLSEGSFPGRRDSGEVFPEEMPLDLWRLLRNGLSVFGEGMVATAQARRVAVRLLPPEVLGEILCREGRLTVIGNRYVHPDLKRLGGAQDSRSRVYVGPADCGKTRAALEYVQDLVRESPGQWVVLRIGNLALATGAMGVEFDRSLYDEKHIEPPSKAILFLDEVLQSMPATRDDSTGADNLSMLLKWFQEETTFQEKLLVGTIRIEDLHGRQGSWGVLQALVPQVEIEGIAPLDASRYLSLWEGMGSGKISASHSTGPRPFAVSLEEGFLSAVARRPADPEAVATFIQQSIFLGRTSLTTDDSGRFSESAVGTWLRESWPVIQKTYGMAARVFFTLARFLESGLRSQNTRTISIGANWAFHVAWGPELCLLHGATAESYLSTVSGLLNTGHAFGKVGVWARPACDFILQAAVLEGVELVLPKSDWFIERAEGLERPFRIRIAWALTVSGDSWQLPACSGDAAWLLGKGLGFNALLTGETEPSRRAVLITYLVATMRSAVEKHPTDPGSWIVFGLSLITAAEEQEDSRLQHELQLEAAAAYRQAIKLEPKDGRLPNVLLGRLVTEMARREMDFRLSAELLEEAIVVLGRAVAASGASNNITWKADSLKGLTWALLNKAERLESLQRLATLVTAVKCAREIVTTDASDSVAWSYLGFSLRKQAAESAADSEVHGRLIEEALEATRRALTLMPENARAWFNLGQIIEAKMVVEANSCQREDLRSEAVAAYSKLLEFSGTSLEGLAALCEVVERLPADEVKQRLSLIDSIIVSFGNALASEASQRRWYELGVRAGRMAERLPTDSRFKRLRDLEILAYRAHVAARPNDSRAFVNLGISLAEKADREGLNDQENSLNEEAITSFRAAVAADPSDARGWFGLGAALEKKLGEVKDQGGRKLIHEEAVSALKRAVESDPSHTRAWFRLGLLLGYEAEREFDQGVKLRLLNEAIHAFRTAADRLGDGRGGVLYNLAVAVAARISLLAVSPILEPVVEEALRLLETYVSEEPTTSEFLGEFGLLLAIKARLESDVVARASQRDKALAILRQAIRADPTNSGAYANLAVTLEESACDEANYERRAFAWNEVFSAYREGEAKVASAATLRSRFAAALRRRSVEVLELSLKVQLLDEAIESLKRAIAEEPGDPMWRINLGDSLFFRSQLETRARRRRRFLNEAVSVLREAVDLDPGESAGWFNLGVCLRDREKDQDSADRKNQDLDNAIEAWQKAIALGEVKAWVELGVSMGKKANRLHDASATKEFRSKELKAYRHAIEAIPDDGRAWLMLGGRLLEKLAEIPTEERQQEVGEVLNTLRHARILLAPEEVPAEELSLLLCTGYRLTGSEGILSEARHYAEQAANGQESRRYALACVYALSEQRVEAFAELGGCLVRKEVTRRRVTADRNWDELRKDPLSKKVLGPFAWFGVRG